MKSLNLLLVLGALFAHSESARHPHLPPYLLGRPTEHGFVRHGDRFFTNFDTPAPNLNRSTISQKVDNFDANNNAMYNQRYWYNPTFTQNKNIVFLMIQGEAPATDTWISNPNYQYLQWAKEFGADVFQLEHRCFGQSRPYPDTSMPGIKVCTMTQALADIHNFIQQMNRRFNFQNPKWITFGGSYPGTLSALFRQQYPADTVGAVASSAPLDWTLDFFEYAMVVEDVLKKTSVDCWRNPLKPHRCAVSKVKFDETGSYVLSCANDSKIVVSGVGNDKLCCTINIQVMPKSIYFSPDFIRQQSGHCFIMGERNLVLYEKRMFQYKASSLYSGSERDGFIHCCSWNENLIAFTNDTGTRVYERGAERIITSVQPSHDVDRVRSSRSPPKHTWMPENNLVIGWADTVTILKIRDDDGVKKGEVHHIFHVSMFICGISYIPESGIDNMELFLVGLQLEGEDFDDCASVISTVTTLTALESSACTILKTSVIRPLGLKEFELQSEDMIESEISSVKLSNHTLPYMIHGLGIPYLATYFILTTKHIIMAVPYGPEDGIRWRLKYKLYDEALDMAKHNADLLSKTDLSPKKVGRMIIEGYLTGKRARAAASRLPLICGECKEEWEWAVNQFEEVKLCTLLAEVLPDGTPTLDPECYQKVLIACLFNNVKQFRKLVQTWSPDLYMTSFIIDRTQWRIQQISKSGNLADVDETERVLMDALAHLYLYERKYESALKILMSCQDFQIFNVIDKHQLFDLVKDQITELMNINSERALRLLLDNADSVEPSFVMEKIGRQPKLQLAYLTKLMSRNEGTEFADKAVQLYAEYDQKKLLPFLRKNANYNVNKARKLCSDKGYIEETIYLLAKSGNHYDAVKMMVREYRNMEKVIDYCKDQNDPDLWIHLLGVVAEFPAHFSQLIIEASNCLDPLLIMDKLPDDSDIPNLSEALDKLLVDYTNHAELQQCCYDSTLNDLNVLTQGLISAADESVSVNIVSRCSLCAQIIINSNQETTKKFSDIKVFKCGHIFHLACSTSEMERRQSIEEGLCIACSDQIELINV